MRSELGQYVHLRVVSQSRLAGIGSLANRCSSDGNNATIFKEPQDGSNLILRTCVSLDPTMQTWMWPPLQQNKLNKYFLENLRKVIPGGRAKFILLLSKMGSAFLKISCR